MVDAETIANSGFQFAVDKIRNFEVRPDDIFLLTYPKSGTTWLKQIVPLVLNAGDTQTYKDVPIDVRVPYLEFSLSAKENERCGVIHSGFNVPDEFDIQGMTSPRVFNSHLRQEFLPSQLEEKKPRVIYCARNPKDVAVSNFYFNQLLLRQRGGEYSDFGSFLQDFIDMKERAHSVVYDGSKWNKHVLEWWNRRNEENVLFLKYEDMVNDLRSNILRIAKFLDIHMSDDTTDKITEQCTFSSMKKNKMALRSHFCSNLLEVNPEEGSPFVRKGGIGGWKNYFTVSQNEHFDGVYADWLKDSDFEIEFEP